MNGTHSTVPKTWAENLVVELRLRAVSGGAFGDALKHVESYCQDSRESPDEAFGPAREYARSRSFAEGRLDDVSAGRMIRVAVPCFVGPVGMLISQTTFDAWRAGEAVAFSVGSHVLLPVTVALSIAATGWLDVIVHHRVVVTIAVELIFGGAAIALLFLKTVAFTAPVAV